jgi:hypothetical protein
MGLILKYKGILHPDKKKEVAEQVQKAITEDGLVILDEHWEVVHTDNKVRVHIPDKKEDK